jgi:hypothetical protein
MVKKSFLLVLLFAFMFLASGCITIYTDGCSSDKRSAQCVKRTDKGEAGKEPNMVKKADDWVKDNLW